MLVAQAESSAGLPVTRAAHHNPATCPQFALLKPCSEFLPERSVLGVLYFFFTLRYWLHSQDELHEPMQPAYAFVSVPLTDGDVGSPGPLQVAVSVAAAAGAPGPGSCSR